MGWRSELEEAGEGRDAAAALPAGEWACHGGQVRVRLVNGPVMGQVNGPATAHHVLLANGPAMAVKVRLRRRRDDGAHASVGVRVLVPCVCWVPLFRTLIIGYRWGPPHPYPHDDGV